MTPASRSRIADPSLAPAGEQRIRWVERHSPVLNRLARERLADGVLRGRRVAVVVHLEAKTAYLALLLAEAGADVVVSGSNPGSTQDAICAALVARGLEVHARHGASRDEFDADLLAVADTAPEIVVDDGCELTARIVEHRPERVATLQGVTEETTTGVARLRAMEAAGRLTFPAIAANDARCKHLFDNRYGTGQSTLAAIDRLTNLTFAGREFCIVGYGWVGKGLARYAAGEGGRVTVVEVDPVAALEAHMDGYRVARLEDGLPDADVLITATGAIDAVPHEALTLLKDGVLLANGGHHEREIAIDGLGPGDEVRPGVTEHDLGDGRRAYVLAEGRQTNVAGGDGHPVEIMDLSFSVQALAAHLLAQGGLEPGLHTFPAELDAEIARTKLATLGIELGEPTEAQRDFSGRWSVA
jgi:adenosylhomocysteinase